MVALGMTSDSSKLVVLDARSDAILNEDRHPCILRQGNDHDCGVFTAISQYCCCLGVDPFISQGDIDCGDFRAYMFLCFVSQSLLATKDDWFSSRRQEALSDPPASPSLVHPPGDSTHISTPVRTSPGRSPPLSGGTTLSQLNGSEGCTTPPALLSTVPSTPLPSGTTGQNLDGSDDLTAISISLSPLASSLTESPLKRNSVQGSLDHQEEYQVATHTHI